MPFIAFYHTHKLVVILFIAIYLIKAILLLMGNKDTLNKYNKIIKVPEMIVSALLFITGIVMLNQIADFNLLFTIKLSLVIGAIPVAVIAYKKYNKVLAVLAVIMLFSAYGLAEVFKAQFGKKQEVMEVLTDPASDEYNIRVHGAALYTAQCIVCHGTDGTASFSGAKDLTLSTKSAGEIIETIKNGKNTMPKMADIYSEQELNALAEYVKSLR
jgi:mono/diheme cytochrome c family protein